MVRGPGPSERLGIVVDGGDVVADCLFELAGRAVHSAAGLLLGQLGKKPLDLVDPRRRGWREGNMPARTSGQPSANGWGLWVEQLSITNWTSRSRGTLVSISRRNLRNSRPRWRVLCWAGTMVSESTLAAAPGRRFSSPSITKSLDRSRHEISEQSPARRQRDRCLPVHGTMHIRFPLRLSIQCMVAITSPCPMPAITQLPAARQVGHYLGYTGRALDGLVVQLRA